MRKFLVAFLVLVLMSGEASAKVWGTDCYKRKDTTINKTGDWFATLGKKGPEKKRVLAKRKRDRFLACVQKNQESGPRGRIS